MNDEKIPDCFLLSNLRASDTGVEGAVLWISAGEFAPGHAVHGPRIMVMLGEKITTEGLDMAVSVRLTDPPEILGELPGEVERDVVRFIAVNRDVLLAHWGGELDARETLDRLQRV
jgi:hypothetical protein